MKGGLDALRARPACAARAGVQLRLSGHVLCAGLSGIPGRPPGRRNGGTSLLLGSRFISGPSSFQPHFPAAWGGGHLGVGGQARRHPAHHKVLPLQLACAPATCSL